MLGELTANQIETVLQVQVVGRIGCHAGDTTYVVPTTYAYDGQYVYGHTKEGMKIDMMRKNPKVCFEVDAMENMSNWRSVIAWGTYEELTDPEARKVGMQKLIDRVMPLLTGETTISHAMTDGHGEYIEAMKGVVYRIRLTKKTGRYEKR
jgi:nitroimidazol reductase NimA-like FMN-containing flavoprotein (pyridoxamine 5'-phosphate oxidase superfamily)